MRILQLISSEGYYGSESMLATLALSHYGLGYHSRVAVFRDSRNPHTELARVAEQRGLPVAVIPCEGRWDWNAVREVRSLVRETNVDVLHTHGYKADLYAYLACRRNGVTLFATCHNWPSKLLTMRMYAALDRRVLKRFHGVATPSPVVENILRRCGVEKTRLSWIGNGVEMERFQKGEPILRCEIGASRKHIVGFVGRLVTSKGGSVLLHAARNVIATCPDTIFVFVGEGPCRSEWEDLASSLGISGNVVFAGNRTDMHNVYASLDLMVLPSFDEALPMCVLEAMSARKPVIATRVGAIPRVVIPGETGLVVEPGDVGSLSEAIVSLLQNAGLARQFSEQGHAHIARYFSSDAIGRAYLALYQRALQN